MTCHVGLTKCIHGAFVGTMLSLIHEHEGVAGLVAAYNSTCWGKCSCKLEADGEMSKLALPAAGQMHFKIPKYFDMRFAGALVVLLDLNERISCIFPAALPAAPVFSLACCNFWAGHA